MPGQRNAINPNLDCLILPTLHPPRNISRELEVPGPYKRPCFDSSVFIAGLGEGEIAHGIKREVVFRFFWEKARLGEFEVFISAVTLAEVFKVKHRKSSSALMLDEFIECVDEPFVQVIEVDREIGLTAHQFCRSGQKLYPNDAIVMACAIRANCDVLLAWDGPLAAVSHSSIQIEAPRIYERDLFTDSEIATDAEIRAYDARIRLEVADAQSSSNAAGMAKVHAERDALADRIVELSKNGKLPAQFTIRQIKDLIGEQPATLALTKILPDYCNGGIRVSNGATARFSRLSKGPNTLL